MKRGRGTVGDDSDGSLTFLRQEVPLDEVKRRQRWAVIVMKKLPFSSILSCLFSGDSILFKRLLEKMKVSLHVGHAIFTSAEFLFEE